MVVSWFPSHPLPGPPSPHNPLGPTWSTTGAPLPRGPFQERHTASRTEKDCSQDQIVISLILLTLKMSPSLPARRMFSGGWCQSNWWPGIISSSFWPFPASTFHSDQSTVSKQHPPCKKRRSGSLALSWHPPRIYWLGYKVKDQLTPTFWYRVVFNVPPNFQYQNEKNSLARK